MANYRSPVDVQNAQDFSAGSAFGSVNQLAQLLQRKQQAEMGREHEESQLRLAQMLKQKAQEEAQARSIGLVEDLSKRHPRDSVSVTPEGASIHVPAIPLTYDARKEGQRQGLIGKVKKDYDSLIGSQRKRLLALQNVQEALAKGDIASIGQIKANLPILEGENYKPTDAERRLFITPTASGMIQTAKNFMGMDTGAPLSSEQKRAFADFLERKINEEHQLSERAKREVSKRWGHHVKLWDPEIVNDISSTLDESSGDLLNQLKERHGAVKSSMADPSAPTGGVMSFEEFKRKKASGEIK